MLVALFPHMGPCASGKGIAGRSLCSDDESTFKISLKRSARKLQLYAVLRALIDWCRSTQSILLVGSRKDSLLGDDEIMMSRVRNIATRRVCTAARDPRRHSSGIGAGSTNAPFVGKILRSTIDARDSQLCYVERRQRRNLQNLTSALIIPPALIECHRRCRKIDLLGSTRYSPSSLRLWLRP